MAVRFKKSAGHEPRTYSIPDAKARKGGVGDIINT